MLDKNKLEIWLRSMAGTHRRAAMIGERKNVKAIQQAKCDVYEHVVAMLATFETETEK
jgi:hypothetical protein